MSSTRSPLRPSAGYVESHGERSATIPIDDLRRFSYVATITMSAPLPTDAELMIIRALWKLGPSTVRQVWDELNTDRETPVVYTTVLKAMQVMHEKGILQRDDSARSHVYRPSAKPETVKRSLVRDLMDRLFDGSARELVVEALGSKKISRKELTEIRKLLDNLDP